MTSIIYHLKNSTSCVHQKGGKRRKVMTLKSLLLKRKVKLIQYETWLHAWFLLWEKSRSKVLTIPKNLLGMVKTYVVLFIVRRTDCFHCVFGCISTVVFDGTLSFCRCVIICEVRWPKYFVIVTCISTYHIAYHSWNGEENFFAVMTCLLPYLFVCFITWVDWYFKATLMAQMVLFDCIRGIG